MYDKQSMFIYPKIHSSKYLIPSITTFGFFIASMLVRLSLWLDTDGLKSKPRKGNPGPNSLRSPNTNTSPPIQSVTMANLTWNGKKHFGTSGGMKQTFGGKWLIFHMKNQPAFVGFSVGGRPGGSINYISGRCRFFFMNPRFGSLLKSGRCWNLTCKKYTM